MRETMSDALWDFKDPHAWMQRTARSAMPPLIVCCAISGGIQGKETHPALPETAEEQAQAAYDAANAGASMIHIHARNTERLYESSDRAEDYRAVKQLIRARSPEVIINFSTGGSYGMSDEQRLACLDAGPEVASLNLGPEMYKFTLKARNPPLAHPRPEAQLDGLHPASYGQIHCFAAEMQRRGVKPELELYNPGMYWVVRDLQAAGLLADPPLVQFVLGTMTGSYPTPWTLLSLLQELPPGCLFEVAAIGPYQLPMTTMAIMLGGHVRVGLEDNLYARKGQLLASNAEAVERVVRIARELNREIATPAQARALLGLAPTPA
jgi:3-keto-5-aminohexanoate cleavage enzyme